MNLVNKRLWTIELNDLIKRTRSKIKILCDKLNYQIFI